jgi:molybdopterin molybdotransferase
MSDKGEKILLAEALSIVEQKLADITLPIETIPVRQAYGRIIVEDQKACFDLPVFNKSAMDGYAVLAGDHRQKYRLIEIVPAGKTPTQKLEPGTAIKVMTGAPVPEGTGQVIMVEQTREADGKVSIISHSEETHICRKGEDINRGDLALKAPAVLGPLEIASLISVGITEIKVAKTVRIAILSTGNEIVDSPENIIPGKIMNSNGPMLEALCQRYSLEVTINTIVKDDRDATVSAIRTALDNSDIVVLSGGVSVGDYDYVAEAISLAGLNVHFNRVAVKPGKPMTFASAGKKAIFGLPGNPVAVFLMFHLFVLYAARLIAGVKNRARYFSLPLASDFHRRKAERMAFLPCQLKPDASLIPVEYHGTAHLLALMDCDGFFTVPIGETDIYAGQEVSFLSIKDSFQ